jgi:hypothetical protein
MVSFLIGDTFMTPLSNAAIDPIIPRPLRRMDWDVARVTSVINDIGRAGEIEAAFAVDSSRPPAAATVTASPRRERRPSSRPRALASRLRTVPTGQSSCRAARS